MAFMRRRQPGQVPSGGGGGRFAPRYQEDASPPATTDPGTSPVVPATRTGRAWVSLTAGFIVLIVVLVFILQNLKSAKVSFFWVHWNIPVALDLLLAAILGGVVVLTAGSLRILQLRRLAKRRLYDSPPPEA